MFKTDILEVVELRAKDALPLMLKVAVIPVDEQQWRPRGRRLKTGSIKKYSKKDK